MNRFSTFFRYDEEAHFRVLVTQLHTLFDGRRDTVTFFALIKASDISTAEKDKLKIQLAQLQTVSGKIKVLRDNLFAHRSHSEHYEEVYARAHLTPDEIALLLEGSVRLFNDLASLLNQLKFEPVPFVGPDTKNLLDALKVGANSPPAA